jgi:hypothetical protein
LRITNAREVDVAAVVKTSASAPLSGPVIVALAQLVDDAQAGRRDPSHSDLDLIIDRAGLNSADPKRQGHVVGKARRVQLTLNWALENDLEAGVALVKELVEMVRGHGGFREGSLNFVGSEAIANLIGAFDADGYVMFPDGQFRCKLLDNISGKELSDALNLYVQRAKRGANDAALVTGTGKDLLEAVAAHILQQRYGSYPESSNFPTLLGQAFVELGLATSHEPPIVGEPSIKRVDRAMYDLACAINGLRNKEGTGHGRPWLPSVSEGEARFAIEFMGIVAERLLLLNDSTR